VLRAKLAAAALSDSERELVVKGGNELRDLARRKAILGQGPALLAGDLRLSVPTYVVWGEEDDLRVIEALRRGPPHVRPPRKVR